MFLLLLDEFNSLSCVNCSRSWIGDIGKQDWLLWRRSAYLQRWHLFWFSPVWGLSLWLEFASEKAKPMLRCLLQVFAAWRFESIFPFDMFASSFRLTVSIHSPLWMVVQLQSFSLGSFWSHYFTSRYRYIFWYKKVMLVYVVTMKLKRNNIDILERYWNASAAVRVCSQVKYFHSHRHHPPLWGRTVIKFTKEKEHTSLPKKRKKIFGEQTKIFSVLPLSTRRPRTGAKRFCSKAGWWIVNPLINSSPRCCRESMRAKQAQLLWSYRVVGLDHWECNASILSRSVHLSKSPGFPLRTMWWWWRWKGGWLAFCDNCSSCARAFCTLSFSAICIRFCPPVETHCLAFVGNIFFQIIIVFSPHKKRVNWLIQLLMRELWQTPPPSSFDYATFQNLRSSPSRNTNRNIPFFNFWFYHLWKIQTSLIIAFEIQLIMLLIGFKNIVMNCSTNNDNVVPLGLAAQLTLWLSVRLGTLILECD